MDDVAHILERIFFYPGNKVCDVCYAQTDDARMMVRTLVNMLVWNVLVVLLVVSQY